MGSVAKPYKKKGFLIYEEMRKYLIKYEEAVSHIGLLQLILSEIPYIMHEENFILFLFSVMHSLFWCVLPLAA
jgi:hypothetical protein